MPSRNLRASSWLSALGAVVIGVAGLLSVRLRGRDDA
jgi:hypothetical protein